MRAIQLFAILIPALTVATPVPAPEPAPVSADAFADFPVNVIMLAGAAQFGAWIPHDGIWRASSTMTCLNAGANSYGACSTPSYDHVGVVAGNGPCSFIGRNGFFATLQGNAGEGFATIAPPQQITWVACGP